MTFIDNEDEDRAFKRLKKRSLDTGTPLPPPTPPLAAEAPPKTPAAEAAQDPARAFQRLKASSAIIGNQEADPESSAKSIRLGKENNIPPELIDVDRGAWEDSLRDKRNLTISDNNPAIQSYLAENPMAAKVSKNDLPLLDSISKFMNLAWKVQKQFNPTGASALAVKAEKEPGTEGFLSELGKMGNPALWVEDFQRGGAGYRHAVLTHQYQKADPETRKRLDPILRAFEDEQNAKPPSGANHVQKVLSQFLGQTWEAGPEVAMYTAAGMIGGGVLGSAFGPAGTATGVSMGGKAGFTYGVSVTAAITSAGQLYRKVEKIEGLNETERQVLSMGGGLAVGLLEARGGHLVQEGISQVLTRLASDKAGKVALSTFVNTTVRYAGEGGAINGAQTLAELLTEKVAQSIGSRDPKVMAKIFSDKDTATKFWGEVAQSFVDGAIIGTVLSGPAYIRGRGTRTGDAIAANRVLADANKLNEVIRMSEQTDTKKLSPDLYADFLKRTENDSNFFIDPQAVVENKNVFSFIPDLDQQIKNAVGFGMEIKVSRNDYVAHVPPEVHALIESRIRQSSEAQNPAEAQAGLLATLKADEVQAVQAQQAAAQPEAAIPPPPPTVMSREQLISGIFGEQPVPTPEAQPPVPPTQAAPAAIPPQLAQIGQLVDRLLGRRVLPTPDQLQAQIVAENEAKIRANIKAAQPPTETPIQQAQGAPTPEALSTAPQVVTEQTKPGVLVSPAAEAIPPVVDAEQAVKKGVTVGPRARATLLEQLKMLSEASVPVDASEAILALALQRDPGNVAELRTFINEELRAAGITEPVLIKEIHDRAGAALAALETKLVKEEGGAIVYGLPDPDARNAAIAAAAQIDSSRHVQWVSPLMEPIELPFAERAEYNRGLLEVQKELTGAILDTAREIVEKKETKAWKNQSAAMRPDVTRDIAQKPIIMMDEFFRTGSATGLLPEKLTAKLLREQVDGMFTPGELRAMGVKGKYLSRNALMNTSMFGKGETVMDADQLAAHFGYPDGKTMMTDLLKFRQSLKETGESPVQRFDRLVDEEVAARMIAEHGNLAEIIERNAEKAAHTVAQDRVLGLELKMLSKLSAKEMLKAADIKKSVDDLMKNMKNSDASDVARYDNLAGVHGKKAKELHEKRDFEGALNEKQLQIKNTLMARYAAQVAREFRQIEKDVAKVTGRARIDAIAPDYNTRMIQLAHMTGLEITGRSPETLMRDLDKMDDASYAAWATARRGKGEAIPTLSYLQKGPPPNAQMTVADMTVADSRELHGALKTLEQLGKTEKTLRLGNQVVEVDAILDVIEANVERIRHRYREGPIPQRSTRRGLASELLKIETVTREADMEFRTGALHSSGMLDKVLIQEVKRAQGKFQTLKRKIADTLKTVDHGEWTGGNRYVGANRLNDLVPNTTMLDTRGVPHEIRRGNMLMVALNWGSAEGRAMMANTLNTDIVTANDWLHKNMTKKNWDFVDNIWRMYENHIVPEMDNVYRLQRGFGMERPDTIDFLDGFGNPRKGGYFPIIREHFGSLPALKEAVIFDNRLYDSLPGNSHIADLKSGKISLSLDFDALQYRIQEQVHAIAYREPVRNLTKIIENDRFQSIMRGAFGLEKANLFKPWLRDVANDGGRYDNTVAHNWQWFFRSLLKNAVQTFTGYNLATASIHSPAAAANTMGELGLRTFKALGAALGDNWIATLAKKIVMSPENYAKYADYAFRNSTELQARWKTNNNDIGRSLGTWSRKQTLNYYAEWWGQSIISYTDYSTAVVAWWGGYQKGMEANIGHEASVMLGDKMVRAAHGSMAIADKSQFHRERNLQQFSAFYGFFNHVGNQIHLAGYNVKQGTIEAKNQQSYRNMGRMLKGAFWTALSSAIFYVAAQSWIHHNVRGDDKEEDHWGKKVGGALLGFGGGIIPGVKEVAFTLGHGWSIASIPITAVMDIPRRWKRDVNKWANEGGPTPVRTTMELAGAGGVRFSTRQMARWAETIQKIRNGTIPPPSTFDEWRRTFVYGAPNPVATKKKKQSDPLGLGLPPGQSRPSGRRKKEGPVQPY